MTRYLYEELPIHLLQAERTLCAVALYLLDRPLCRYAVELGVLMMLVGALLLMR